MATLVPSIGSARFDSRGELRLAERLKDFLEPNAWVWHNLPVGPRGHHPDFVLLHPVRGILVLEVKDWRLENTSNWTKFEVELITARGVVRVGNPIEQVRAYLFTVKQLIERDKALLLPKEHRFHGRPALSFGFGVVFPNITRRQFDLAELGEILPATRCVFRDEMTETVDPDQFRNRFWSMVSPQLGPPLSMLQFDRVRAILFPEIRVTQIGLPLDEPNGDDASDRVMNVMDLPQELLARSLGEGHRIVRGVAGSGKTLVLAFRAQYLARASTRPVLMLCYGNGIAGCLENTMQDRAVEDRVQVWTFHAWCRRMLKQFDIPGPTTAQYPNATDWHAACVNAVLSAVDAGLISSGQYDAVLIDEAHDFESQWLSLAAKMVSPDTRALMICYDDMQAIYKGRTRPVWSQLGIEAKGRTTVLKVNYRNTAQILAFARRFAAEIMAAPGVSADEEDPVLVPLDGGRDGVEPEVRKCVNFDGEGHAIAEWIASRKNAGYTWAQLAVLFPTHAIGVRFANALKRLNVPVDVASENQDRNRVQLGLSAVRLLSMHNAKGLEFPCVAIGGLGKLGSQAKELDDDIRLAYVAVTRATHEAFLTYSYVSPLVERIIAR